MIIGKRTVILHVLYDGFRFDYKYYSFKYQLYCAETRSDQQRWGSKIYS